MDSSPLVAALIGIALIAVATALRLGIHVGVRPGGVDTWYYLASADALRRERRFPISLPQYLLQDRTESYAPGFIAFLALIPERWLRKYFWLIAPFIDVIHLLMLYVITLRLTGNLLAAAIAGGVHALTPHLIAETRSLNPRSVGAFLASVAMFLVFRSLLPADAAEHSRLGAQPWPVVVGAVLVTAALALTHTTTTVAFLVATTVLSVVFFDWRYLGFAVLGLLTALVASGGFYLRVISNSLHAIRFWRRNVRWRGAHPVLDSPVYGDPRPRRPPTSWQGGDLLRSLVRLLGENPFFVPMVLAATPLLTVGWWGQHMYWWAVAVLAWAVCVTLIQPLRVFGPGYLYMKASVFPTGFSLALVLAAPDAWRSLPGIVIVLSFVASAAAIAVLYVYLRTRKSEHTSSTPPDLAAVASSLATMPGDGALVLPTMYADFVAYASGKKVLWGGHSGDLTRFEAIFPVISEPLEGLIQRYGLQYILLDRAYTDLRRLRLDERARLLSQSGSFALYEIVPSGHAVRADARLATGRGHDPAMND